MATDPIREYLDAHSALEQATRAVSSLAQTISYTGHVLTTNWQTLQIGNAEFPGGLVPEGRAVTIDAAKWPTAQQIVTALVAWHRANQAARQAWERVPEEYRERLPSPSPPSRT